MLRSGPSWDLAWRTAVSACRCGTWQCCAQVSCDLAPAADTCCPVPCFWLCCCAWAVLLGVLAEHAYYLLRMMLSYTLGFGAGFPPFQATLGETPPPVACNSSSLRSCTVNVYHGVAACVYPTSPPITRVTCAQLHCRRVCGLGAWFV